MKKILSLMLTILIVIGSFSGVLTVSAEETNLWTDMTVEDFGTKDTTATAQNLYFEQYTNNYGIAFQVYNCYYTTFYVKMPTLEANTKYQLSFKYDNHITSTAGSISRIYAATADEISATNDEGYELPSSTILLGSDIALDQGGYTDFTTTFTTAKDQTEYYLYFYTNFAYLMYLCDFSLTKSPVDTSNALADTTSADWGAKSWSSVSNSTETCEGGNGILVSQAMHQKIYTVVKLEANTTYDFSFNWKSILGTNYGSAAYPSEIYVYPTSKTGDIMNAERESGASANSGKWDTNANFHPLTGELTVEDDLQVESFASQNKDVALTAQWSKLSTSFTTVEDTEYAILIHFNCNGSNDANKIHLSDFNLSKTVFYDVKVTDGIADKKTAKAGDTVTLNATPTEAQTFNYWEVTSGNVTVSDEFSETATFIMPAEDVSVRAVYTENLWGGIDTTWFGTVDTTLNGNFNCTARDDATFSDALSVNMCWYSTFYFKLPSNLVTNTEYELTFNYDNSVQKTASSLLKIYLVTDEELAAANSEGYDIPSSAIALGSNVELDKGGWTELTADFTTGDAETQYYLYFMTNYCYRLYLGGFNLCENTKKLITVQNGTSDVASAKKGKEVTVTANEPAEGMAFDRWDVVSGGVTLADPYSATTTFVMGNDAVSLKAVYREYGAQIVYVNTDGTPYADAANLNPATAEITENSDGTNTVTLSYDTMDGINSFLGWYNGETLLESGLSYTYDPETVDLLTVTAKILCRNVLTGAAGFESYASDTNMRVEPVATGVAPYDDKWGLNSGSYETENIGFYIKTSGEKNTTYFTDVGYDRETSTYYSQNDIKTAKYLATPHNGNSMLEISACYRLFVRKMDGLKPNTSYTLSFYVMNPDEYNFLSSAAVLDNYNEKHSSLKVMSKRLIEKGSSEIYGYYEEERVEPLWETNVTMRDTAAARTWKKISFSFTTGDNTDSMYLYLSTRTRNQWWNRCAIYVDDLVCYENAIDYEGNAMRAASDELPQALRYKFSVNNEMLTSYEGYTFKDLGILAVDSAKLGGEELYKGNEYAQDVKVNESNYQYVDGDTENTYFTAALWGIGRTSTGKMDYTRFANEYAVRPYFVYENTSDAETVIYGNTVTVSVFDVMYAIRDEATNKDDLNTVNAILENANVRKAYSDWQPADGWNIDNPNAPTEYDYSFAVIGDIQYTTEYYPDYLDYTYDWLINNQTDKKLQYVFGTGDITNTSTQTQFTAIDEQLLRLKEAGIVQSIVRGNHDRIAPYDSNITTEKYSYGGEIFESYDGTMKTYYRIITIGGIKYMMLSLDFYPSEAEVIWAKEKVDANPDCNVIVSTHGYLEPDMTLIKDEDVYDVYDRVDSEGNAIGGVAGEYIYNNLILPCSNIVMVICGHEFSYGPEYNTLTREDGSTAIQLLINFQQPEYTDLRSYGMISMLYFSNGGETVTVEWFSAIKNEYYMDKYQFTFDLTVIK